MKLRNKKTGEIKEVEPITIGGFRSLAELNEEWEDVPEEPKEAEYYWYIGYKNDIRRTKYHHTSDFADNQVTETRKEIGNCFESLEEAEKAVEKLKAWKRLRDRGFKFKGYNAQAFGEIKFSIEDDWEDCNFDHLQHKADLDLLFGGEE